jgi:DNA-directed RNA polymerase subunit beta
VTAIDNESIQIEEEEKEDSKPLKTYPISRRPTHGNTIAGFIPTVQSEESVKAGQIIAYPVATENGEIALGRNLLIAFMPYYGWNYEDAIVVSETLVVHFKSQHIREITIDIREGEERTKQKLDRARYSKDEIKLLADANDESNGHHEGVIKNREKVCVGQLLAGRILRGCEG